MVYACSSIAVSAVISSFFCQRCESQVYIIKQNLPSPIWCSSLECAPVLCAVWQSLQLGTRSQIGPFFISPRTPHICLAPPLTQQFFVNASFMNNIHWTFNLNDISFFHHIYNRKSPHAFLKAALRDEYPSSAQGTEHRVFSVHALSNCRIVCQSKDWINFILGVESDLV